MRGFNRLRKLDWGTRTKEIRSANSPFRIENYGGKEEWEELSRACKKRDNWTCRECKTFFPKGQRHRLHAHHKLSVGKFRVNKLSNLITLCDDCHRILHKHMGKKSSKLPVVETKDANFSRRKFFASKRGY